MYVSPHSYFKAMSAVATASSFFQQLLSYFSITIPCMSSSEERPTSAMDEGKEKPQWLYSAHTND